MLWEARLHADRPSIRRHQTYLRLEFRAEDGSAFASNSVEAEQARKIWSALEGGLERNYQLRLTILKNRMAHDLEDWFHAFFPNPGGYGEAFARLFEETGHTILFSVDAPEWQWFPLEAFYFNQQFLALRHCVIRRTGSTECHAPQAGQSFAALTGAAKLGSGEWADASRLLASTRRAEDRMLAAELQPRPQNPFQADHIYYIGHHEIGKGLALQTDDENGDSTWFSANQLQTNEEPPASVFLNACHSAAAYTESTDADSRDEPFATWAAQRQAPLFIGHAGRIAPEFAASLADRFYDAWLGRRQSAPEAWRQALGSQTSLQMQDGSAALIGCRFYAAHPAFKINAKQQNESQAQQTAGSTASTLSARQASLRLALRAAVALLLGLILIFLFFKSRDTPFMTPMSQPRMVLRGNVLYSTKPWMITNKGTPVSLLPVKYEDQVTTIVLEQDVQIAHQSTLNIPAGLDIIIAPKRRIICHGRLEAYGEVNAPIRFLARDAAEASRWGGIFIGPKTYQDLSPFASFSYCEFSGGGGVAISHRTQPDPQLGQNWFEYDQIDIPPFGQDVAVPAQSHRGGAIFAWRAAPEFYNCRFENNSAAYGGAVYLRNTGFGAVMSDCVFENNKSQIVGGALFLLGAMFEADELHFTNNRTGQAGGAICVFRDSSLTLRHSAFINNRSGIAGGGIYFYTKKGSAQRENCEHTLEQLEFYGNTAGRDGAGISYDGDNGDLKAKNLIFKGNRLIGQATEGIPNPADEQNKEGCALFFNPENDNPQEPLHVEFSSIIARGNIIVWREHYNHDGQTIQASGSAAYFGPCMDVRLNLAQWTVSDNMGYNSCTPIGYDERMEGASLEAIERITRTLNPAANPNRKIPPEEAEQIARNIMTQ
ncbi:hypothetical protein JXA32_01825 [Candidatus Sumerlaeota bacterium]|nr:hypothetical protein [Candidatus Sumerlaeota bacterium]